MKKLGLIGLLVYGLRVSVSADDDKQPEVEDGRRFDPGTGRL